ncbi:MAG: FAD:protein FMN transferase, partial [Anaerolineales bacterium]
PNSEVSILNRQGYLTRAASALIEILKLSKRFSQISGGAFDITIKPILDLFAQNHASNANLPSKEELTLAKTLVNYQNVIVEGDQVSFTKPGMEISLDGIAKGYIVDQGVSILRELGFDSILVEAGGDLYASGDRNPGKRWNIGVRSPRSASTELLTHVSITNQSAATSGDYMNTFSTDFNHHHIIDPHTGHSNTELSSVTVIYPHTVGADALATSIMVLGVDKGLELANSLPDCEAMLITKDLKTLQTDGFLN